MVTTTHSIHCGSTSGSHELPPAAEGEHRILVWLGQPYYHSYEVYNGYIRPDAEVRGSFRLINPEAYTQLIRFQISDQCCCCCCW